MSTDRHDTLTRLLRKEMAGHYQIIAILAKTKPEYVRRVMAGYVGWKYDRDTWTSTRVIKAALEYRRVLRIARRNAITRLNAKAVASCS